DVLALASMPGFDPNLFVNGIDTKSYRKLADSPNRPLFNRAIKGRYPPGSTLKPFIGLAGLESDVVKAETRIFCKGWFQLKHDKHKYRDWKIYGHGQINLREAITQSCDVYFYTLALNLGIDRISRYNAYFGFGQSTGIDILGETVGINPSREWKRRAKHESWYPGETLITGIGQGFNVTSPLQLAEGVAILATYGLHIRPHLALAFEESESGTLEYLEPVVMAQVPVEKKENWDNIIESMAAVVSSRRGSARNIRSKNYNIAGKTGTAQVFSIKQNEKYDKENLRDNLRDHALFVAFAPKEDPELAVAVIVENGESGGRVAAPIARKVLDAYLLGSGETTHN
ncbi:MAG TPA: penicillin-binding protein 2, partial [Gammaproteobacteria bacterium]|nr:penicillin-binding protein 2 [Gammaproteobacteria bacterium]